jgi:RNase P/RNase MRP subunit p29
MEAAMLHSFVEIKKTQHEPPEFRGVKGRVIRETGHGYVVVYTTDKREVILHPDSVRVLEKRQ